MKTIELSAALASAPVQENLKNFAGLDAQNALGLMTPERLAAVAGDFLLDGVKILYHNKSDSDFPYCAEIKSWSTLEAQGQIASGVLLIQGDRHLVIAPTEATESLAWSTAAVSGGGTTASDRLVAFSDWNGKESTKKQVSHAECNTETLAPGFCNRYARPNANGKGLIAGKWWLPSVAEMMLIYANKKKINAALSVIKGASKLSESWYWTSTEYSATNAWGFYLSNGGVSYWRGKVKTKDRVRAVSAFIV